MKTSGALVHVDRPGLEDRLGVHFAMMFGNMSVRVFVSRAAIAGGSSHFEGSCLARFETDRGLFEAVAREKFNPDRPVSKIMIAHEDILGAPPERKSTLSEAAEDARKGSEVSSILVDKLNVLKEE